MALPNRTLARTAAREARRAMAPGPLLLAVICLPILLFLLVPILIIVPMALTRATCSPFRRTASRFVRSSTSSTILNGSPPP